MYRASVKDSKGGAFKSSGFTGGLEGRKPDGQVTAKITDDSFTYKRIAPTGVVVQILWVIFTMFEFYLKPPKNELHRKTAHSGFGWQYFFRVIITLSFKVYI